jgi:hypothetical protein
MTSRIIRDSALTSYSLDQLSDGAERLWWRLTLVADDWGRFNADPRVVCSTCFPLRAVELDPTVILTWMDELQAVGGIHRYEVNGHQYGYFVNWPQYQRPARYKSKFPNPEHRSLAENSGPQPPLAENSGSAGIQELGIEKGVEKGVLSIEDGRYQPPTAAISGQSKAFSNPQNHTTKRADPGSGQHDTVTASDRSIPPVEKTREYLASLRRRFEEESS